VDRVRHRRPPRALCGSNTGTATSRSCTALADEEHREQAPWPSRRRGCRGGSASTSSGASRQRRPHRPWHLSGRPTVYQRFGLGLRPLGRLAALHGSRSTADGSSGSRPEGSCAVEPGRASPERSRGHGQSAIEPLPRCAFDLLGVGRQSPGHRPAVAGQPRHSIFVARMTPHLVAGTVVEHEAEVGGLGAGAFTWTFPDAVVVERARRRERQVAGTAVRGAVSRPATGAPAAGVGQRRRVGLADGSSSGGGHGRCLSGAGRTGTQIAIAASG
jgi:hypothetical protein